MSGFKVTRKAKQEDNSWVETYADAITLLMAFFVVLLSMSTMNKKKYEYMVEVIHQGINKSVITTEAPMEQDGKTEEIRSFVKQPVPALSEMSYLNTLADVTYDIHHDGEGDWPVVHGGNHGYYIVTSFWLFFANVVVRGWCRHFPPAVSTNFH